MKILFNETEHTSKLAFVGIVNNEIAGYAQLYYRAGTILELCGLWLTDYGKSQLDYHAFAEAFFKHLKCLGYTKLYMETDDMEDGERLSFQLQERDNSGWHPKYIYYRIL